MTLNDIIMRDLAICRKEQSLEDYNREISRRLWRRRGKALLEAVGYLFFFAMIAAGCWVCCACSGYHWE